MITLYPDQQAAKEQLYSLARQGYKRPLLVAPTGYGKGCVAGDIIQDSLRKNPHNRICFVVNRRALVKDMSKRLNRLGIYHGIMMGPQTRGLHMNVIIASVQSLRNRLTDKMKFNLVFVDEAHTFMSDECQRVLDQLEANGAFIINMTATPWLLSGRGLEEISDVMIQGPQADVLMSTGRLVQPVIYAPKAPNMDGVKKNRDGEFDEKQTAERMSDTKLIGDMVKHWYKLAKGKRTIGFATDKTTAKLYADDFNAAGIRSSTVTDETPDGDENTPGTREYIWKKLSDRELDVVWTVGVVSYGFDMPELEAIILARPTMSLALHLQQCGRVLRSCPGKTEGIIIDHAGNTVRRYPGGQYGLPDAHREWTLEPRRKNAKADEENEGEGQLPRVCPIDGINPDTLKECPEPKKILKPDAAECPVCGYQFSKSGRGGGEQGALEIDKTGELQRIESRVYIYPDKTGNSNKDNLLEIAQRNNYHPKWVEHVHAALETSRQKYRQIVGKEPKEYWSAKQINSALKQFSGSQTALPL